MRMRSKQKKMATSSKEKVGLAKDYSIGSSVSCEICNKEICRGNVLAYDNPFRTIMIESPDTGKVHIINVENATIKLLSSDKLKYIDVGKQKLDLNKIDRKYQDAVKRRKEELSKIGDGVTLEAQLLFNRIISVYGQTAWDNDVIVVMNDVRVSPPYKPENCTGTAQALERIQKIVEKFNREDTTSKQSQPAPHPPPPTTTTT